MKVAVAFVSTLAISLSAIGTASASSQRRVSGSITVFAASSLTEAFTQIRRGFEHQYRDTDVRLSFNASSTLVTQIQQGAPADVVASADTATMEQLVASGKVRADDRAPFARNRLEIAVQPGNPKHIRTLADTVKRGVTLVLCAPEAPCGKLARQAYTKAGVNLPNVPTGANVKDTLTKVTLGEADAAVVYVTDVGAARGDVEGVTIPAGQNVVATSPIAPVVGAPNGPGAKAFVLYALSKAGQRILRRFGFLPA